MSRLAQYLDRIPAGWASFPNCRAKAVLFTRLAALAEREWLPPELVKRLDSPMLSTAWAPEMEQVALMLAIYDHRVHGDADEAAYHEEMLRLNMKLFESPSYAPLVANASPARLMRMMSESWKLFHRGTDLQLREAAPGRVIMDFTFPPLLYPEESIRTRTTSVRGALMAAQAKGVQVHYSIESPGHVCYDATWSV